MFKISFNYRATLQFILLLNYGRGIALSDLSADQQSQSSIDPVGRHYIAPVCHEAGS